MTKAEMRRAKPEDIRRLANFIFKTTGIADMGDKQIIRLLDWYFKRAEKKRRGLALKDAWGW